MPIVAGVVFREAGKVYYFNPLKLSLVLNDNVIVKTSHGTEYGRVVMLPQEISEDEITPPLKKIIRKATEEDKFKLAENKLKEKEAFEACEEKIKEYKLDMKLVSVEMGFDRGKITFFFVSEERIDFRRLVKDLATLLKARIELRQIGVRDKAKLIGGLGPCGLRLCCSAFLEDFAPVSIKMAKDQDLPLNPNKISGACGRLMCCLKYESDLYAEFKKSAPKKGEELEVLEGKGIVVDYCMPKNMIIVELEGGRKIEVSLEDVKRGRHSANDALERSDTPD
ncbi:MAG: stage 0 sporulation family protein [Actinobacteria bacterium]|nr:stage 0 sporulation family protein [Actinomycetota bacterium]